MPGQPTVAVPETERLQAFLRPLGSLCPLSPIAQNLVRSPRPAKGKMQTLVSILTGDTDITARVVRVINSLDFSIPCQVQSIHHAVSLLGLETVRQLCVGVAAIRAFSGGHQSAPDVIPWLWKHAIAVGLAARAVARRIRYPDSEVLFTAGLMHDIGHVLLLEHAPDELQKAALEAEKKRTSLLEAEQTVFGFDHRHVGEWMAAQWKLPRIIKLAILRHHDPDSYAWDSEAEQRAVSLVAVADEAAHFRGLSFCTTHPTIDVPDTLAYLKLEGEDVTELTENLVAETEAFYNHVQP
jgi:putative nucleotidyltransferase with HDIG domain